MVSASLDPDAISTAVCGGLIRQVRVVEATPSTNADLARLAAEDAPGGLVLVTDDQTAGRGRFDRSWVTPPGTAVALSALVYPTAPLARWGWLSLLVGVAVVDGLRRATPLEPLLKWPNDVLLGERKVCGILSESVVSDLGRAAVLGLGINISQDADQLPVPTATSLRQEGADAAASDVVIAVLHALEHWYGRWDAGESLRDAYRARCATIGQAVAVHIGESEPVTGRAVDVDDDGRLVVETPAGRRAFSAGDVVHLRRGAV